MKNAMSMMKSSSYEVYRQISEDSKRNGLEIRWSGRVSCAPNFVLDRYHKRFLLVYVVDGVCLYDAGERTIPLGPGNLICFLPGQRQHFRTHDKLLLNYYGIAFSGRMIEQILRNKILFSANVHGIGLRENLVALMHELIEKMMVISESMDEVILGLFFSIIGEINQAIIASSKTTGSDYSQLVRLRKTEEFIRLNYHKKLELELLADMSGYSVSWFEKIFRKHYQLSPVSYQMKQRIDRAKDMIRSDILSISEIGYAVGFNDPLHFSKMFKKKVGISPKKYRNLALGHVSQQRVLTRSEES